MRLLPAAFTLPEPIRPRRCDCQQFGEPEDCASELMDEQGCGECGGALFLYPDPPDFASIYAADRVSGSSNRAIGFVDWKPGDWIDWQRFCRLTWAVLGVVDTDA